MKNIAFAFLGPFPKGNVSTVRILSYTKEMVKNGCDVTVYILAPSNDAKINKIKKGCYDGVNYVYLSKITWSKENVFFLVKLGYYLFGLWSFLKIVMLRKHNCVISYHNEFVFNILVKIVCQFKNIRFNLDITEYPKGFNSFSKFRKIIEKLGLKKYNGIITVSDELVEFYSSLIKGKVFKLPITIDINRYNVSFVSVGERKNVITCVFGTHNRDGLINTLKVYQKYFNLCYENGVENWELQLIGDFTKIKFLHKSVFEYCESIKNELFFQSVRVVGQVDNELFPHIISNSRILINTPSSYDSGGFPTKLGEYLMTGVPVIYTKAGEVSKVLCDKVNSYLFESTEIDCISLCIYNLQFDYDTANKIGLKGRELALNIFNAEKYIKELLNYCYNEN